MSLFVRRIAGGATLQDAGRQGYRKFGVPPGGAFDMRALQVANAMVGSDRFAPALELCAWGAEFEAAQDIAIGLAGAEAEVRRNSSLVSGSGVVPLRRGDILTIGPFLTGARLYVALPGGIQAPLVLGSASGSEVHPGSTLVPLRSESFGPRAMKPLADGGALVALYIPAEGTDPAFHARIGATHFRIGLHSNRAGVRLSGFPEAHHIERLSEPMDVGAIQWTPSGELIVIGPDGPTVGGYPRIGTMIRPHLGLVAQMSPSKAARIAPVQTDFAERAILEIERRHEAMIERLMPSPR